MSFHSTHTYVLLTNFVTHQFILQQVVSNTVVSLLRLSSSYNTYRYWVCFPCTLRILRRAQHAFLRYSVSRQRQNEIESYTEALQGFDGKRNVRKSTNGTIQGASYERQYERRIYYTDAVPHPRTGITVIESLGRCLRTLDLGAQEI
jgi:hypothetical protein